MQNISLYKFKELSPVSQAKVIQHNDLKVFSTTKSAVNRLSETMNRFVEEITGIKNLFEYKTLLGDVVEFFINTDLLFDREIKKQLPKDNSPELVNWISNQVRDILFSKPEYKSIEPLVIKTIREFKTIESPILYLFFKSIADKLTYSSTLFFYNANKYPGYFSEWILEKVPNILFPAPVEKPDFISDFTYLPGGDRMEIDNDMFH